MSDAAKIAQMIKDADRVLIFTGAGISTESGIPDFRSPGGVWSKMSPIYFQDFVASREKRKEAWDRVYNRTAGWTGASPLRGAHRWAALVAGAAVLWAGLSSLVVALGFLFLLLQHALRFSSYPRDVALLAAATLAVLVFLRFVLAKLDWFHPSSRKWVLAALGVVWLLRMTVVFYPLRVSSDADFQANRMMYFLEGNWHLTSVTQHVPPFDIPYPVSLYSITAPLVLFGADGVAALSFMTGFFDVVVSILLIYLGWRFLDDLRAGILGGILYQLVPLNALSFSAGNFTNLFAVAALSLAFVFMFSSPVICAFWTFLALTAHLGMLIEGAILWPAWLFFFWLGLWLGCFFRGNKFSGTGVSHIVVVLLYWYLITNEHEVEWVVQEDCFPQQSVSDGLEMGQVCVNGGFCDTAVF